MDLLLRSRFFHLEYLKNLLQVQHDTTVMLSWVILKIQLLNLGDKVGK